MNKKASPLPVGNKASSDVRQERKTQPTTQDPAYSSDKDILEVAATPPKDQPASA